MPPPAQLGYRMPAEWEPHAATWLAWPHNRATWPGKFEPVPAVYARFIRALAEVETVNVLAGGEAVMAEARALVGNVPNVVLQDIPTNDVWTRDHGPTFLVGPGEPALIDWQYNAWGGKYPPFDLDNAVPRHVARLQGRRRFEPGIILEGDAIDPNGRGAILTTEQCLLNPNRNPGLTKREVERYLADYLAAPHVLWLGQGIVGDDTDGHIDELARFVSERTVVAIVEDDPADENHAPLQDNLRRLKSMTDQEGRPLEIVHLPMPRPKFQDNQRLPMSYCNFYIANGLVVVPEFGDPADAVALDTLRRLFPDRRVVAQYALDLVWGLGCFHCITQQEPASY